MCIHSNTPLSVRISPNFIPNPMCTCTGRWLWLCLCSSKKNRAARRNFAAQITSECQSKNRNFRLKCTTNKYETESKIHVKTQSKMIESRNVSQMIIKQQQNIFALECHRSSYWHTAICNNVDSNNNTIHTNLCRHGILVDSYSKWR